MALTTTQRDLADNMCRSAEISQIGTAVYNLEQSQPTGDVVGTTDTQTITNKTVGVPNDALLTLGTTTATAETKITMKFDETTTGVGIKNVGTTSVPQVLNKNPGSAVVCDTINILHSAGAGDCDDLYVSYHKAAVTGDGDAGLTVVGDAPRVYVGTTAGTTVASEAYAAQPWAKHEGTGTITAMSSLSALLNVGEDAFTSTNSINAGHFHIRGDATVTSSHFDGVMIEAYGDVTCMDSMLKLSIDTGAVVDSAIKITGALAANFLDISAASTGVVVAAGSGLTHDPNAVTSDAYLVVKIDSTNYAMPLYQI